ncbi:hypothetical protein AMEX_G5292 [Astyanax mexicanus]|uniref:KIAA1522 n=1 Tax=Astyanax mexicanus TaxID=7994 RepID=A0A8T2MCY4_ASTMX|nr:hypothetical protein AMEX_G5292 [Astyanax mexicanus]
MSRSSSMGDLVPRDITEVLARQSKVSKSKKKRGSSLGRAFSWFKGSKQKRSVSNGQSRSGSLAGRTGESTTVRQGLTNHESSKVGQKQDEQRKLTVHYTASQHYQENVFIEGSRPKYLEDLHTEAQEGLKILQQEEHNNGVDFKDVQTVSSDTTQEKDESLDLDPTADHLSNITSVSSRPPASSRPVLTRQGSTFKPLNTVKRPDKTRKRTRRTTIMGIPQHVQRELCMGRGGLLQQLPNGEDSAGTVIIPTIDGGAPITNHEGAYVHLQDIEALQASRDEQLLRHHLQVMYGNDLPRMSPMQRPKSLAVPGMTTMSSLLQEQGPVMSISPQATYLSTIIPNAVLPAAIDVIEIDRSHTRRSVRTVSKSSLASASPGSSRSGGGNHDGPPSYSSKRSNSQSSETLVSNSSRGNRIPSHAAERKKEDLNHDEQIKSSSSCLSSSTKAASHKLEQGEQSEPGESVQNSQFSRSLSIMKAKLPPAPPRRTYSLHQEKMKQRSNKVDDKKDLNGLQSSDVRMSGDVTSTNHETISTNSPVTTFLDNSHLSLTFSPHSPDQDSTDAQTGSGSSSPQNKFERTMSPSSGYSSQSGTPTHSSKDFNPTSPGKHKKKPPKPERIGPRTSPVVSVSSSTNSLSSAATDPAPLSSQTQTTQLQPPKVSPTALAESNKATGSTSLRDLFNIPPPPRVKAPCPPPPETWAHNKRTVELLCGPSPCPNRIFGLQKQHKDSSLEKRNQDATNCTDQTSLDREISVYIKTTEEPEDSKVKVVTTEVKNDASIVALDGNLALGLTESPSKHVKEEESCLEKETVSCVAKGKEQNISENLKVDQESGVNSEKILAPAQQLESEKYEQNTSSLLDNDALTPKTEENGTEDQYSKVKPCTDKGIPTHRHKENASIDAPRVNGHSPPPSPPPTYHPPPPPSKRSPASSVSTPLPQEELLNAELGMEKEYPVLECAWPPPPPPMDVSADLVFEGQDEVDFPPPPPPPPMQELLSDMPKNNMESIEQRGIPATEESSAVPDIGSQSEQDQSSTVVEKTFNEQPRVEVSETKSNDQSPVKPLFSENAQQVCLDPPEISSQSQPLKHKDLSSQPLEDQPNAVPSSVNHLSQQASSEAPALATEVPTAPPLPMEEQSTLSFRRQPSPTSKDIRSKELLSRHKSAPIPKEDANIPLVTPSLLQMVRLRSVNVEDQVNTLLQEGKPETEDTRGQDQGMLSQVTPQKPIRKSCIKSTQPSVKSSPAAAQGPSMRLQEAIRMKTAAMSSSGVPARLSLRLPTPTTNSSNDTAPVPSPKSPDSSDLLKSPASTASFIFSKSTKKVVIETPTSPEVQASLKQNLAAELMQISDQARSLETKKQVKVPPPVARKPAHATNPVEKLGTGSALTSENSSSKQNVGLENGQIQTVQPAGQRAQSPGTKMPASATETARILEVS